MRGAREKTERGKSGDKAGAQARDQQYGETSEQKEKVGRCWEGDNGERRDDTHKSRWKYY